MRSVNKIKLRIASPSYSLVVRSYYGAYTIPPGLTHGQLVHEVARASNSNINLFGLEPWPNQ